MSDHGCTCTMSPMKLQKLDFFKHYRPCLSWRDVQSILVYSAVKVDVKGAEWVENGAGFHHSDQHGFGLMDAYRLTTVARAWPLLPQMEKWEVPRGGRSQRTIPGKGSSLLITVIGKSRVVSCMVVESLNIIKDILGFCPYWQSECSK